MVHGGRSRREAVRAGPRRRRSLAHGDDTGVSFWTRGAVFSESDQISTDKNKKGKRERT